MSLFSPRKCYMGCVFLQIRMSYYAPFPAFYPYPVDYYPLYGPVQMGPNSQMFYAPAPGTRPKRWPEFPAAQARIQQPEGVQRFRNFWRFQQKSFEVEKFQSNGKKKVYDSLFGNWGQALFRPAKNWERACLAIVLCPGLRKCVYWFKVPGPHLQICIHTITFKYLSHLSEEIFQQANRRTII